MASLRCHCQGNPECKLCHGKKFYEYQPGERGWMPFRCPTCEGRRVVTNEEGQEERCFSCEGNGNVDPGYPAFTPGWLGAMRAGWKIFFGGG